MVIPPGGFVTNCPHRYPQVWSNYRDNSEPQMGIAIPPRVDSFGEVNREWCSVTTENHMPQVKARIQAPQACRRTISQVAGGSA